MNMNLTNYFIVLGLPVIFVLATFIIAVIFHKSQFLTKVFFWSMVSGLAFEFVLVFLGIAIAVIGWIGD